MKNIWSFLKRVGARVKPSAGVQRGMGVALQAVGLFLLLAVWVLFLGSSLTLGSALGSFVFIGGLLVATLAILLSYLIASKLQPRLRVGLLVFGVAVLPYLGGVSVPGSLLLGGSLLLFVLMIGGAIASRAESGWRWHNLGFALLGTLGVLALGLAFLMPGWQKEDGIDWQPMTSQELQAPSPLQTGSHSVERYTYGSGRDLHRPEYAEQASFVSESVDASKLLDGWSAGAGWSRSRHWGFGPDAIPIQGRAFLPSGDGPFPVVLIVHGNHLMEDYSDAGYAYLGEHFASRGFATVSVDQNFLNSSFGDLLGLVDGGLDEENDARAWLLLMHLRQLSRWNRESGHDWFGKLDLDRVVLIGHSRGGEAVSEAAVFNRLSAYPDDATLPFDFNFGIRGIVAIAPVDHQYNPRGRPTKPADVSYLVLHGSHDGDVNSFAGAALYSRLRFEHCQNCFKAGIYLIGANHGQFNTSWGRRDAPAPFSNLLNLSLLMDAETQRSFAKATITPFLEATLLNDPVAERALASPDRIHALLPGGTQYLSQFRHATDVVLADFEEDADVATATHHGVTLSADNLALWREGEIQMKWRASDNAGVVLGWNGDSDAANYSFEFDAPRVFDAGASLALALAMSDETPGELDGYEQPDAIDFTLVLSDTSGNQARVALSQRRSLLPLVKPSVYKLDLLDEDPATETVFQRYRFAVNEWLVDEPRLDLNAITGLSLVFDGTVAGAIVLDDVVLSRQGF